MREKPQKEMVQDSHFNPHKKPCIICGVSKPLIDFYKHSAMADGHLNKCKECTKRQSKEREEALRNDPNWIQKEKDRARKKYHRLYKGVVKKSPMKRKEHQNTYKNRYPEKRRAVSSSQNIMKGSKIFEIHHWSYNEQHYKDVIILRKEVHYEIHRHIKYDQSLMMYRSEEGELLDSKQKHVDYMMQYIIPAREFFDQFK